MQRTPEATRRQKRKVEGNGDPAQPDHDVVHTECHRLPVTPATKMDGITVLANENEMQREQLMEKTMEDFFFW